MKPTAIVFVVLILTILAIAKVTLADNTANFPPVLPGTLIATNIELHFTPAFELDPSWINHLPPGIYETRSYEILCKVPDQTGDNCIINNQRPSLMPELHPELKVAPAPAALTPSKSGR